MQQTISFNIELPLDKPIKHLTSKSRYNHNYYELCEYGEWISFGEKHNNILYEEYDECCNCYTYAFGRFENGKFVEVLSYSTTKDVLENIDTIE